MEHGAHSVPRQVSIRENMTTACARHSDLIDGRHNARHYSDAVEAELRKALQHPRCVGAGEFGLDYYYDKSPKHVQREVLVRQIKLALEVGRPMTIHTREADEDIERILKENVPRDHKVRGPSGPDHTARTRADVPAPGFQIHVHCFNDTLELAQSLLAHFPNLYIGQASVIVPIAHVAHSCAQE
jgi:TatD DNase family protein